jgi:hypothetical protein
MPRGWRPALRCVVQLADEARQCSKHVLARGFGGQRLARDIARNVGQYFPALVVDAQRDRCAGKADTVQMSQIGLDSCCEGPDRPPHGVPDPHNPGRDTVTDERFAFARAVFSVHRH